ncbi:MAG: hypothetical protein ABIK15_03535 [Pseudomonadota bacterium]
MKASGNQPSLKRYAAIHQSSLLFCILLILVSCASLPKIEPFRLPLPAGEEIRCRQPYLTGKWQLVHSVKAVLPNGLRQSMIGTIIVSPERNTVHCVLLSIEGLVLVDAVYDQEVIVNRAVPPFDEPEVVAGLIDDVRLLFLKPSGMPTEIGFSEKRSTICRYRSGEGRTVDVIAHPDGNWEIRQYGSSDRMERSVRGFFVEKNRTDGGSGEIVPERLELTAHGFVGYKLSLDLIEAIPLSSQGFPE